MRIIICKPNTSINSPLSPRAYLLDRYHVVATCVHLVTVPALSPPAKRSLLSS
ncbi:hypothetical protein DPMN_066672 [Dreissena polymorpha]|uniref:Uncharacterized protein n=1 Tax=Dreissena polymorpha TaxID=45954 RepID=A0A9D3YYA5_DREPO|nr:hypothetical protein DPMN_066672 [Dreissena polymorpha]